MLMIMKTNDDGYKGSDMITYLMSTVSLFIKFLGKKANHLLIDQQLCPRSQFDHLKLV